MGDIPAEMRAGVKAQLLAFLLYSTLASLQQLAAAFGGDSLEVYGSEEPAEQLLPGPHAALRCLFWLDSGKPSAKIPEWIYPKLRNNPKCSLTSSVACV